MHMRYAARAAAIMIMILMVGGALPAEEAAGKAGPAAQEARRLMEAAFAEIGPGALPDQASMDRLALRLELALRAGTSASEAFRIARRAAFLYARGGEAGLRALRAMEGQGVRSERKAAKDFAQRVGQGKADEQPGRGQPSDLEGPGQ
jgi:hypothetical protein